MPASLLTVTPLTASGIAHVADNIPQAGIIAWFDAYKITGISSGASISAWTDASGNGSTVTQTSAASQPVYVTNQLNGLPVVQFNGGQTLTGTDLDLSMAAHTLFAVSSVSTIPSGVNFSVLGKGTVASGQQYCLNYATGGTAPFQYRFFTGAATENVNAITGNSVNSFKALGAQWSGTTYIFYRGVATDGSTASTHSGTQNNQVLLIGGEANGNSQFLKGAIAEIIIYNRALSPSEITVVQTYLTQKWAV